MKHAFSLIWRSLVVGAGYAGTLGLTNALLGRGADTRSLIWLFVGGTAIGLALGPLAASMPAAWKRHMLVWGSIIFLNIASLTIEGRLFAPGHVQGSIGVMLLQQLVLSLVTAFLIVRLFGAVTEAAPIPAVVRPWFSWTWRFLAAALAYIFVYYLFGAISYLLVTGSYYKAHAGGLVTPAPGVILQAELMRAPLIVLSIIPFLLTFRAPRKRILVLTGVTRREDVERYPYRPARIVSSVAEIEP